ncbi:MAG: diacylglycerol kinase family protein [Candidatus Paceibacterota bacterium]
MEQKLSEKKRFSIVARAKSFNHAFRGIGILVKSTHNLWVHLIITIFVILFGFILKVSLIEWLFLILAIGLVLITEALNTAIEIDIDLTSPNYHPYARDTKDVASGAVLISAATAAFIGLIIFLPKIIGFL